MLLGAGRSAVADLGISTIADASARGHRRDRADGHGERAQRPAHHDPAPKEH
jgi:hypothetical protein